MEKLKIAVLVVTMSFCSVAQSQTSNFQIDTKNDLITHLPEVKLRSLNQSTLDCSDTNYIYCEDFESASSPALPSNMTTSSLENGYNVNVNSTDQNVDGFYTGDSEDANVGGYWPVTSHTQFAMTNDDACKPNGVSPNENNNCDLSFETLGLPMLDFTNHSSIYLIFDFYHDKNYGGGDAQVEVKSGNQISWTDISGNLANVGEWQEGIFSLSDYEGMDSVFIRFKWSDNNKWATGFAVDNIVIDKLEDNDISLVTYDHYMPGSRYISNYSIIPQSQVTNPSIFFRSVVLNRGNNDQDSVRMKVDINSEGFNTQSWAKNIASLERDTFFSNMYFNTNNTGTYTVDFYAESDSATSDTLKREIEVSEYTFARDNNEQTLSFKLQSAYGGQQTIEHGNSFYISEAVELYAVDVFISADSDPNGKVQAKLYQITSGSANFLQESNILGIVNTNAWQSVKFSSPIALEKEIEYLVTIGGDGTVTSDTTRIGATSSRSSSFGWRIFNGYQGTGSTAPSDGIYLSIPMVRMNFDPNVEGPIGVSENKNIDFSIFPNPNNGEFSLKINNVTNNSIMNVHNVLGQLVHTEVLEKTQTKQINLTHLQKGIYTITINQNEKKSITQKIVIR